MSENNLQIDLSKAYAGQSVTLRSNDTFTIEFCSIKNENEIVMQFCSDGAMTYALDGTYIGVRNLPKWDILKLEDPKQVQEAYLKGEIRGLERASNLASLTSDKNLFIVLANKFKEQLKALQAEIAIDLKTPKTK